MKQPYNTTIYNTALYMRLSRDDELQGESGSIQTQRMMLRQYAAEHGLNVIDEYIDDGWSGTNFDRPDFQRMSLNKSSCLKKPVFMRVSAISISLLITN